MNLIETTFSPSESEMRVDRENRIIHGVKILGRQSKNGREYSQEALEALPGMYESMQVNIDHPDRKNPKAERSIADGFGILKNTRLKEDGVYGDLHYLESHGQAAAIAERAERMPYSFGLSHNAEGKTKRKDGKIVVESVEAVHSVDIVSRPATTSGLFESEQKTVAEILDEADEADSGYALLLEVVEGGGVPPDLAVDLPAGSTSDGSIKQAFRAAVIAIFDDESLDAEATIGRIREVIKAQEKIMDKKEDKTKVEDQATDDKKDVNESVPESIQNELNELKARNMLLEAGRHATPERIAAVAAVPEDMRQALVESWNDEQTVPRPERSPAKYEQAGAVHFSRDPKKFAASFK